MRLPESEDKGLRANVFKNPLQVQTPKVFRILLLGGKEKKLTTAAQAQYFCKMYFNF